MGLEQWDKAMQDAQKGLELAQRDNDKQIIELLEEKMTQIEAAIKAQNDNNNE